VLLKFKIFYPPLAGAVEEVPPGGCGSPPDSGGVGGSVDGGDSEEVLLDVSPGVEGLPLVSPGVDEVVGGVGERLLVFD